MWNKEIEQDFVELKKAFTKGRMGWRSVHLNHRLKQVEHKGSVILGAGWAGEVPWILGEEV